MRFDLTAMAPRAAHDLLTGAILPRPIAWVSSIDAAGRVNLAPFSFFSGVAWDPPTVSVSVVNRDDGSRKDTVLNIEDTGQFVVNMVNEEMGALMVRTAATLPRGVDEAAEAGVVLVPSTVVPVPRVKDARIAFECELDRIVAVESGAGGANLVLGRIRLLHVSDAILDARANVDAGKARLLGRLGGKLFCTLQSAIEIDPSNE